MAQRISQLPSEYIPYAQEALPYSSTEQGLGAMTLPNIGRANMTDGGPHSKANANPQQFRNLVQKNQEIQQNAIAEAPQLAAQNVGMLRNQMSQQSTADYKAQMGLQIVKANLLEDRIPGGGMAIKKLSDPVEAEKAFNAVAITQSMHGRQASELGQLGVESNRYRA